MPYPNEHVARLRNTQDFRANTFRRTSGGGVSGIDVPRTVAIIWAKLTDQTDGMTAQSLRFPTKYWTAERAMQWIKDNGIECVSFEAAEKKNKCLSLSESESVSISGTILNLSAVTSTECQATPEGDMPRRFQIHAYTGAEFVTLIKGKPARGIVDLASMRFPSDPMPILREHDVNHPTGVADMHDISTEDGYYLTGEYLNTDDGEKVCDSMDQSFPWQASIRVESDNLQFVPNGEFIELNNREFFGPGYVMRDGLIKEVSFCVFGADGNTSALSLAEGDTTSVEVATPLQEEEKSMALEELTLAALKEGRPDLAEALATEGREAANEQVRLAALEEGKALGLSEGVKQEQERVLSLCETSLQFSKAPGITGEQLGEIFCAALSAAKEHVSVEDIDAKLKEVRRVQLTKESPDSPGPNDDPEKKAEEAVEEAEEAKLTDTWQKAHLRAQRMCKADGTIQYSAALTMALRELNSKGDK